MGVFNATQGQYLPSPIRSNMKGRAMRASIEGSELQNEINRDALENAPAARAAAAAKAQREVDKDQRDADKHLREMSDEQKADVRDANIAAQDVFDKTGNIEQATAAFKASADMGPNTPGIGKELDAFEWNPETAAAQNAIFDENKSSSRSAQKFIDNDGKPVQGSMDKEGNYYDSSGTQRTDITPIAPQAGQDDLSGASDDKTAARQIREVMGATDNLLDSMDRIGALVESASQASLGLPGDISGLVDRSISAANGFAEIAGGWTEMNGEAVDSTKLLDTRLYADLFEGISGTNAAIQANAVGVSYALARAANPDGRISDADVRHQLNRLQLNQSSKTRIGAAMNEVKRSQLGSAMNWLRTSGATKTEEGRASFSKYETMLNEMDGDGGDNEDTDGLPVGTIEGEYTFMGGDPADKNNWNKQ